jgi:Family of unknown function (DUF5995)
VDDPIAEVAKRLQDRAHAVPPHYLAFLDTYRRTTLAVGTAVADAKFEDPEWVQAWDVTFAELYLDALDADLEGRTTDVPRPWRLTFDAPADLPALRRVLLGINAHINYDLPQALLAVISVDDFADPVLVARRQRDHERIDAVLASRVSDEDDVLASEGRTLLDRVLAPLNRRSSQRFLQESRQKVWHNTWQLHEARLDGKDVYERRLAELEVLSAARIADLLAPGQVLLRLAVAGFGVTLPPP